MNAIRKLLGNMRETLAAGVGQAALPVRDDAGTGKAACPTAGPNDGWRIDRGTGMLALDRIVEDPDQPREEFDEAELAGLGASVKAHGMLQPVLVRWRPDLGLWMLVAGARRFRAARAAGLAAIPAKRIEGEPSADDVLLQRIAEQLVRADWNPMEEAFAISNAALSRSWTGREASAALGLTEMRVSRAFTLARELRADLQALVRSGKISAMVGVELARLPPDEALELAGQRPTKRQAAAAVQKRRKPMQRRGAAPQPAAQQPRSVTRIPVAGGAVIVELDQASDSNAVRAALQQALQAYGRGEQAA